MGEYFIEDGHLKWLHVDYHSAMCWCEQDIVEDGLFARAVPYNTRLPLTIIKRLSK